MTCRRKRDLHTVKLTNFYITEGNLYDHFYVEQLSGRLIVLKKPTYKDTPQFNLKVRNDTELRVGGSIGKGADC